jgi:hypothetical protein
MTSRSIIVPIMIYVDAMQRQSINDNSNLVTYDYASQANDLASNVLGFVSMLLIKALFPNKPKILFYSFYWFNIYPN